MGLLLVGGVAACNDDDPVGPADGEVTEIRLGAITFQPAMVVIPAGTTVRWVNDLDEQHTVTPDGHSEWDEWVTARAGDTFEHTFDTPGDYDYYCIPHLAQGMTGVIRVQ